LVTIYSTCEFSCVILDVVCLLEPRSTPQTTPETRALPHASEPNTPTRILRQAVNRPRLELPQSAQPSHSGDDDGLLVYKIIVYKKLQTIYLMLYKRQIKKQQKSKV